jgi:predicted HTH domain antitoxin
MTIEITEQELGAAKLTVSEARLDLAVGLYSGRRVSMGKAAHIAGVPYPEFLRELGRRGISVNYGVEDFEHDCNVLENLRGNDCRQ